MTAGKTETEVVGYVLAGGGSTRFGRDKALVEVGGTPMLKRMIELLRQVTKEVKIVAAANKYAAFGVTTVEDRWPGEGPLGGIITALEDAARTAARPEWNLILSCDMLLLPARSQRRAIHSRVRNGMSQLRIRFHSGRAAVRAASSSAVMIPPSGPSPGQRSSTVVTPNAAYLFAAATIFTSFVTCRSSSIMRFSIGVPPTSTSALSRPNRVLPPPAKTYPTTSVSVFPAVILHLSVSFLFLAFSALLWSLFHFLFFFQGFSAWPADSQLAQFLLQTLPVQSDGRRGSGDVPAMRGQLPGQVGHFKILLGLPEIPFADTVVRLVAPMLHRNRLAVHHLSRQILDTNFVSARKHDAPLQRILQLPHIARPVIFLDRCQSFPLQPHRPPQSRSMQLQKRCRQQRNILFVSTQRRQLNGHHAQPVKQVLAKLSGADLRGQIAVRRADHPHIHRNRLRPAKPFNGAILQHAQHLSLRHRIHVPDLIEENRAARGQLELPFFLLRRSRKRPAFVTEQFRFDQRLRQRRTIHRNISLSGAR